MASPRLVILNDWLTPYRIPLYARLARDFPELTVLLCTERIREYPWASSAELPFQTELLPRLELRLRRPPYREPRIIFVNPTLLLRLIHHRPDVLVTFAFSLPTWTALFYAALTGTPLLSWSNDTLHTERLLGGLQRLSRRVVIARAAACITASEQSREKYLAYGAHPDRVFKVLQVPDIDHFAKGADEARRSGTTYRDQHNLQGPLVLNVGALSELKGVRHLLEAFRLVHKTLPEARLLFVGDGPLRAELAELAQGYSLSDAVHFAGFVQQGKLPAIYASADVFVFSTLGDTFGTVLGEAAACGLPIITSPFAGGATEYVRPEENGLIIDTRDHDELAEGIIAILSNPARRESMGQASHRLAIEHDVDQSADAFAAAIDRATTKSGRNSSNSVSSIKER